MQSQSLIHDDLDIPALTARADLMAADLQQTRVTAGLATQVGNLTVNTGPPSTHSFPPGPGPAAVLNVNTQNTVPLSLYESRWHGSPLYVPPSRTFPQAAPASTMPAARPALLFHLPNPTSAPFPLPAAEAQARNDILEADKSAAMAEVAAANKERFQFQAMADKTILQKDFDNQMLHQQNQALHQQIQALQQELQLLRGFVPHLASNSAHLQAGPPPSSAPLQAGPPPSSALFQAGPPPSPAQFQAGPPPSSALLQAGPPPSSAQFQAGPPPSQAHCQAAPSTSSVPLQPDPHASSALALRPSPVGTPPTQQRAQPTYAAAIAPTPTPGADGCYNLTPEQYRSLVAKGENSNTGKLSVSKPPTYSGKGRPDRWLDKVVQCFQAACIPEKDYITHTLPLLEINSHADAWWRSIGSTIPDLSWGDFKEMLNTHFIRDTRDPELVVRHKLHSGRITQGTNNVSSYVLNFRQTTMDAIDMSQTDLIQWFLKGLNDQIRPLCMTNYMGQQWGTLDELIEYSHAMETRIYAQGRASKNINPKPHNKSYRDSRPATAPRHAAPMRSQGKRSRGTQDGSSSKRQYVLMGDTDWFKYCRDHPKERCKQPNWTQFTNAEVVHCYDHRICAKCFGSTDLKHNPNITCPKNCPRNGKPALKKPDNLMQLTGVGGVITPNAL